MPKGDVHKKKEVVQVGTERQPSSGDHPKWRLISALYTHTHRGGVKFDETKIELIESIFESIG